MLSRAMSSCFHQPAPALTCFRTTNTGVRCFGRRSGALAKPHLRVAYIIVAVHLVFLGGLLIQGCKKEDQPSARTGQPTNDTVLPPLDQANLYPTNPAPSPTNLQEVTTAPPGPIPTSPTLASPQPESVAAREYVVVRGDNFTTLGRKFGVTAPAIARANPGVNSTQLKV